MKSGTVVGQGDPPEKGAPISAAGPAAGRFVVRYLREGLASWGVPTVLPTSAMTIWAARTRHDAARLKCCAQRFKVP